MLWSLPTVASFALTRPAFRGKERRIQRFRLKSSLAQPNKDISADNSLLISFKEKKGTELWLDLRGTAIYPSAAISYLMEQLTDDEYDPYSLAEGAPNPIDRVLLSDQMFQRLLNAPDHPMEGTEIMYLPDDSGGLVVSSHEGMSSFPCGKLFEMPRDSDMVLADPMAAIETIAKGNWVVLVDGKSGIDSDSEVNRVDSIASFLHLAVAAAGGPSLVDGSSGLLLKSSEYEDTTELGGVAVSCSNKAMIIQLASVVQDMKAGSSMASTESGILIQGTNSDSPSSSPSLQTALLLPFDVVMWKTALLIYGEIPKDEEEEV
jgi:hypothetical protein